MHVWGRMYAQASGIGALMLLLLCESISSIPDNQQLSWEEEGMI
jgi:hypothetical protein